MFFDVKSLRMSAAAGLVIAVCVVDSVTIAFDGSLMGSLNVMPSYNSYFHITTATQVVNTCSTFLGAILVGPFTGMLIDRRGRKFGLYIAAIINIVGAVIAGAAQHIGMFIAGRIIIGMGVGFGQTAASTYVAETTAPKIRAFALGLYFSCWAVGALLAAGISYGTSALEPSNWAWRIPSILQAAPPACALVVLLFLPESPRWLAYNDRPEEALRILARINGTTRDDSAVQEQYLEILGALELEKSHTDDGIKGFVRMLRASHAARRRLMLALSVAPLAMLTGSNVITYYFGSMLSQAGITSSTTQLQINVILSSWQLVVATAGSALADKLGRRVLALLSLCLCTFFFYLLAGLTARFGSSSSGAGSGEAPSSTNTAGVYGTVACIFLFLGTYSFGITPLTAMYAPEVLPYHMRASGIALQGMLIKTCGVLVTVVFPYLMDAIGWRAYIANASWNLLLVVYIYFRWVETKGLTLEEVDAIFEDEPRVIYAADDEGGVAGARVLVEMDEKDTARKLAV